jgi:hypothetical protein
MKKLSVIPIAYAGPSRITALTRIKLSGTDSLYAVSYQWALLSKPNSSLATLSNNNMKEPTLIADVIGDYVIELTVANDAGDSAPTRITITVSNEVTFHPSEISAHVH